MSFASVPILASATGAAVTTIVWLLIAVALVAVLTHFVRVPYTIALVVAGLALGVIGGPFRVPLTEALILDVFIPALLFEAAYNLSWPRLRAEIRPITALAIPGVIAGTFIVGAIVHLAGLRWPVALLFGALISATDPVSVLATFRRIGANRRLSIIVEGESLFNDGTALVVFKLILAFVIAGGVTASTTILAFIASIAGGIAIGLAIGYLGALLLRQIDDYLVEVTVTLLMAYGTFIACEHGHLTVRGNEVGASPVIAVVVLALVTGNYAARSSMSARTRLSMHDTWELIGYFANSLIFLLIGLQVHTASVTRAEIPLILWAIVGILVSRAIVVYGVGLYTNWRNAPVFRIPLRFQHVILWGGLRGAISLAAALSIPGDAVPERPTIIVMTFGIVVFTLLVQGLTIRPLVTRLGLGGTDHSAHLLAFERLQGQLVATQAARRALKDLSDGGEIAPNVFAQVSHAYEERGVRLREALEGLNISANEIRAEQVIVARRKALQAEKDALLSLRKRGTLTGSVYRALNADIDRRLLQIEEEPDAESEAEQSEGNPDPHSETAQ